MKNLIIPGIILIIAGITGLLSNDYKELGLISFLTGLLFNAITLIQNNLERKSIEDLLDELNLINYERYGTNIYLSRFFKNLERKKSGKKDYELLNAAVVKVPNDNRAIIIWLAVELLNIERSYFFKRKHDTYRISHARKMLNRISKKFENDHMYLTVKGVLHDIEGNYIQAQNTFKLMDTKHPSSFWRMYLALSYMKSNEFEKSIKELQDHLKSIGEAWTIMFYLGRAYSGLGEFDEAIKFFKRAFELRGNNPELIYTMNTTYLYLNNRIRASYYQFKLGIILLLLRNPQGLKYLTIASILLPFYLISIISEKLCLITNRIPIFKSVIQKLFSPKWFYSNLGDQLFFDEKYKYALNFYERFLKFNPNCAEFYDKAGLCYACLGNRIKGSEYIKKAIELDSDNVIYLSNLKAVESGEELHPVVASNYGVVKQLAKKHLFHNYK
ncbi:MAG: tetratricopeptide repeat protein [Ignavibacteriaceae bacterium]|jgi:tetratricopeptide (TPR) repeat protein